MGGDGHAGAQVGPGRGAQHQLFLFGYRVAGGYLDDTGLDSRIFNALLDFPHPQVGDKVLVPAPETAGNVQPATRTADELHSRSFRHLLHQRHVTPQVQRRNFHYRVHAALLGLGKGLQGHSQGLVAKLQLVIGLPDTCR